MNRFKIKAIVLWISLLFLACQDEKDCCVNIDTHIDILYKTSTGENLINSSSDFMENDIRVYYKIEDAFEYIFEGNLTYPNMHRVSEQPNGDLILTLFPSDRYDGNYSTTLIELNENTVDTFYCQFDLSGGNHVCTKVWVNGIEKSSRNFELIK